MHIEITVTKVVDGVRQACEPSLLMDEGETSDIVRCLRQAQSSALGARTAEHHRKLADTLQKASR